MNEQDEESRAPETTPPPPRRGGGIAFLALLIALLALGLAAWPWWLEFQGDDPAQRLRADLEDRLDAAEQAQRSLLQRRLEQAETSVDEAVHELRRRLERSERDLEATLAELEDRRREMRAREQELEEAVAGLRRAFTELAVDVAQAAPPDARTWRIAEAAYLLRIANQRARLERDVDGARMLLTAADAILAELDDYALVPVREALLEAKAALAAVPSVDRVGLYLELEAVALEVDGLPLALPAYEPTPVGVTEDDTLASRVARRLGALFDFRMHRGERFRPLLTPDESFWWHHNLRLKLAQAQLALLRGDQTLWNASLAAAADLAEAREGAAAAAVSLRALAERPVKGVAPDISEPLRRLESVQRHRPAEPES